MTDYARFGPRDTWSGTYGESCPEFPPDTSDWDSWREDCIRRGRWIVENKLPTDDVSQVDFAFCVMPYIRSVRDRVAVTGTCGVCCEDELVATRSGQVVCRRTLRPCERQRMRAFIELWGIINGN